MQQEYCDKEKSCYNCKDRTPQCHSNCEYYIRRSENRKKLNEKIQLDKVYDAYKCASIQSRRKKHRKSTRSAFIDKE